MKIFDSVEALEAALGTEVAVSEWATITQDRVNLFAQATDDPQWIHVDVERAT
ncbi:MAG: MaoC/PaaZ C-terminal domain-containing protein, partial [Burkholderiaceae bacterium]